MPAPIKPTHKAILRYHAALAEYHAGQVEHEGALRTAFQTLLQETCKAHHWLLIPEEPTKVGGKTVRPDGTLRDLYNLHRGFWEAKDEHDDLSVEIKKKAGKGYPLTNTIFEDTQRAVLFQGKKEVYQADLTDRQQVADLLQGYSRKVADTHGIVYTPQPIVDFMCASVAEVLDKQFGKKLGDKGVNILDPCTWDPVTVGFEPRTFDGSLQSMRWSKGCWRKRDDRPGKQGGDSSRCHRPRIARGTSEHYLPVH